MEIITRLYLYDGENEANGYRGTDYSANVLSGHTTTEDLQDIIDVAEITLAGLPFREEFAPKTKFILEKWVQNEDGTLDMYRSYSYVVGSDYVEQPELADDTYFNHHITFNEASVDAQGRLCDNISVTYRLKDVSLDIAPTYNITAIASQSTANTFPSLKDVNEFSTFGHSQHGLQIRTKFGFTTEWVFPDWYTVTINGQTATPASLSSMWTEFLLNQQCDAASGQKEITLPVPMLKMYSGKQGTDNWNVYYGCISYKISLRRRSSNSNNAYEEVQSWRIDPSRNDTNEAWRAPSTGSISPYEGVIAAYASHGDPLFSFTYRYQCLALYQDSYANRTITFTIEQGYSYELRCHIAFNCFSEAPQATQDAICAALVPVWGNASEILAYGVPYYSSFQSITGYIVFVGPVDYHNGPFAVTEDYPRNVLTFNAVQSDPTACIAFQSADIPTAYDLFVKAVIATQSFRKIAGTVVEDTPTPYYIDQNYIDELKSTQVIEQFYNQKNLWQMFLDIGKYIHAIPKIRYGADDRFEVSFKKLGVPTAETDSYGTPISIYNSRSIEEYVSACSSYVSNMVQLGGIIEEWIAPKTDSDEYTVYNDVAKLFTQKPITEIVDFEVTYVGSGIYDDEGNMIENCLNDRYLNQTRNLAGKGTHGESPNGYIFEKNVYKLLPIIANANINKGLAIYYELGTNTIEGLSYQLPVVNPGDINEQYALKRILAQVYLGTPTHSSVNDILFNQFVFHIKYRTKDTVRQIQSRPDLRKYLLQSQYDTYPQHNQFNNQQETLIDSQKFGDNVYGTLIRTGNSRYTCSEWVDSPFLLRQTGELYTNNGKLLYVTRVKNAWFCDHIISEVTLSENYNELSPIIGIPSEPRFYEISEQSAIQRGKAFEDFIMLGTRAYSRYNLDSYVRPAGWQFIADLLFGGATYPKFAITAFKNDIQKAYGTPEASQFYVEVLHAIGSYSSRNTLTLSWRMVDNFSAGDQIQARAKTQDKTVDTAYYPLLPFQYKDIFGRADMVDFAIINNFNPTPAEIRNLPANPLTLSEEDSAGNYLFGSELAQEWGDNYHGVIALFDNREVPYFNYNLQMITDSDRFVLSGYLWQQGKTRLKIALLSSEVNKISNETIPDANIIKSTAADVPFSVDTNAGEIVVDIASYLSGITDFATADGLVNSQYAAIAIISDDTIGVSYATAQRYFIMARNIAGLSAEEASENWEITVPPKSIYYRQWIGKDPTSISLNLADTVKRNYLVGEPINTDGVTVTAYYEDGTSEEVPLSRCTVLVPSVTNVGIATVSIYYGSALAQYNIRIMRSRIVIQMDYVNPNIAPNANLQNNFTAIIDKTPLMVYDIYDTPHPITSQSFANGEFTLTPTIAPTEQGLFDVSVTSSFSPNDTNHLGMYSGGGASPRTIKVTFVGRTSTAVANIGEITSAQSEDWDKIVANNTYPSRSPIEHDIIYYTIGGTAYAAEYLNGAWEQSEITAIPTDWKPASSRVNIGLRNYGGLTVTLFAYSRDGTDANTAQYSGTYALNAGTRPLQRYSESGLSWNVSVSNNHMEIAAHPAASTQGIYDAMGATVSFYDASGTLLSTRTGITGRIPSSAAEIRIDIPTNYPS